MAEPPYPLVAHELACIECGRLWFVASERWRLLVTEDDPPEAVAYCPDCAQREFG
jgi:hypothetical protein